MFDAVALSRMFRTWLDNPDDRLESEVRVLASVSEEQWAEVVRAESSIATIAISKRLVSLSYDARARNSDRAVWLAKLATRIAKATWRGPDEIDATILAEGDAWAEYAAALHTVRDEQNAKDAVQRAHTFYELVPGLATEKKVAILNLYEGRILHELGESTAGLAVVERGTNVLRDIFGDDKRYVQGRTMQAGILMGLNQFQEAARVLRSVVKPARDLGDIETYAHITYFIGRCMAKLGQSTKAKTLLKEAAKLFQDLEMRAELPRIRKTLAELAFESGRIDDAIAELYMARQEFLALNQPVVAALVSLDVVDYLLIRERTSEVELLCSEMIRVFTQANLSRNALQALAHLQSLAQDSRVTPEDVQHVRRFFELLPTAPDTPFDMNEEGSGGQNHPPLPS